MTLINSTSDQIFQSNSYPKDFAFDAEVCRVFDDMVSRSIPAYELLTSLICDLALSFSKGGKFLDIGCSTGNTINQILTSSAGSKFAGPGTFGPGFSALVGLDTSEDMLKIAAQKPNIRANADLVELINADICEFELAENSFDVIVINLVLQFIRPLQRLDIIRKLANALKNGGVLIMVEKIIDETPAFNSLYIDAYHRYKETVGYSQEEILRKRLALENKLVPFLDAENTALLRRSGLNDISCFYKILNFKGYLAKKGSE